MILCVPCSRYIEHNNYVLPIYIKTNLRSIYVSAYTRNKLHTRLSGYFNPEFCALMYYA